jgi:hypothetical protein
VLSIHNRIPVPDGAVLMAYGKTTITVKVIPLGSGRYAEPEGFTLGIIRYVEVYKIKHL